MPPPRPASREKTPLVGIGELRSQEALAKMQILQRGNRLSITPVSPAEWKYILGLLDKKNA
jgi:predicted RNA-binding protein with PUA-like domain